MPIKFCDMSNYGSLAPWCLCGMLIGDNWSYSEARTSIYGQHQAFKPCWKAPYVTRHYLAGQETTLLLFSFCADTRVHILQSKVTTTPRVVESETLNNYESPEQAFLFATHVMPSLVPMPRGKREKWPGIHCSCMRENPHDFMGYRIPLFTNR